MFMLGLGEFYPLISIWLGLYLRVPGGCFFQNICPRSHRVGGVFAVAAAVVGVLFSLGVSPAMAASHGGKWPTEFTEVRTPCQTGSDTPCAYLARSGGMDEADGCVLMGESPAKACDTEQAWVFCQEACDLGDQNSCTAASKIGSG